MTLFDFCCVYYDELKLINCMLASFRKEMSDRKYNYYDSKTNGITK
jgi:hypothetical protein